MKSVRFFLVLATALVATWSATARAETDIVRCRNDDAPIPERISACTRAIDSNALSTSDLGGGFYGRGNAWLAKGDFDRAIRDYNAAAQLLPQDVLVFMNRGGAWSAKGEHDRAIADYSEAIRLDPRYAEAIYNRGNEWRAKRDYDRAIADYNEALRLKPQYTFALHNRGIAYYNKGDIDRAIADYSQAIRLGMNDAAIMTERALARVAKGDDDRAMSDFDEAIRLDPRSAQALLSRGLLRLARHDFEGAEKDLAAGDRLRRDAYSITWLYLSRARRGVAAEEELRRAVTTPMKAWPEPIPFLFLGTLRPADLMKLAESGDTQDGGNRCEARFYTAEWHLVRKEPRPAADLLREVVKSCPRTYLEYSLGVAELRALENPGEARPVRASIASTGTHDFPMGSAPEDVSARFPPFKCRPVAAGGRRSFCTYFDPSATQPQFSAPDLNALWEFPVLSMSFYFDDDKLQEISWTFEARGQPGGKVIDPAKLRGALESRFGPPASTHVSSMGRDGGIKVLETMWLVNGERWVYRRYPDGGINVDLRRFSKDAVAK
jgi:tetratricopeptide (TPR) repeat protein